MPLPAVVKNRRLAFLDRLQSEGFFEEAEMRSRCACDTQATRSLLTRRRAPLLYHHVVGRFTEAGACDPGDAPQHAASHAYLRKLEASAVDARLEAALAAELREEHDTDSDSEEEAVRTVPGAQAEAEEAVPDEEHYARVAEFTKLMRERVLMGTETDGVDYATVDADVSLDAKWDRGECTLLNGSEFFFPVMTFLQWFRRRRRKGTSTRMIRIVAHRFSTPHITVFLSRPSCSSRAGCTD
jgi:hypothetical protein